MKSLWILLFCLPVFAKTPFPDSLLIGNVKVYIHPSAKAILETEQKRLGSSKKFVEGMKEKMRYYFPVMEPLLQSAGIPNEFKYLSVQESGLNPVAVSTSQAVGYWQFKAGTATDMGLKVNENVDERKHIIEATKGAANYFTRNNRILNNWVGTLLSYRIGLGTAKKTPYVMDWVGKSDIQVDSTTDWYVLRFLAYQKFWADEFRKDDSLGIKPSKQSKLVIYDNTCGKNLYEIADELNFSYDDLKKHNPWILNDFIPDDKNYILYLPSHVPFFDNSKLIPQIKEPEDFLLPHKKKLDNPQQEQAITDR
jgi:membrane-bound lytic murein transglycosylase D